MTIIVCDNCKNPTIFVTRKDAPENIGKWELTILRKENTIAACSRKCAEHLDSLHRAKLVTTIPMAMDRDAPGDD